MDERWGIFSSKFRISGRKYSDKNLYHRLKFKRATIMLRLNWWNGCRKLTSV